MTNSPEEYQLYFKARAQFESYTPEGYVRVRELVQEAMAQEPNSTWHHTSNVWIYWLEQDAGYAMDSKLARPLALESDSGRPRR